MESYLLRLGESILVLGAPILLYCYFTLAVFALRKSKSVRLQTLEDEKFPFARDARKILVRFDQYVFRSQAGAFIAALIVGWYGLTAVRFSLTLVLTEAFPQFFAADKINALGSGTIIFLVLALITLCTFSIYKIGKAVISSNPERILCLLVIPIYGATKLFSPITYWPDRFGSFLIRRFGLKNPIERELALSSEEMKEIVDHSLEAGHLEEVEGEIIQGVFALANTTVHELMVPRNDVVFLEENASLGQVIQLIEHEKVSRILVTGADMDDVRGVLLVKDLVPLVGISIPEFTLKGVMRTPYFVPAQKRADDLLLDLRQKGIQFAIVLDEHGGVDGIITMEDLIEEIVGEIFDEFDVPADEQTIKDLDDGDIIVDGRVLIDDLNLQYDYDLPTGEYTTLAGLILHRLGRIPEVGEELDCNEITIRVEELDSNRIVSARISPQIDKTKQSSVLTPLHKSETIPIPNESNECEPESIQPRARVAGSK